MDAQQYLLGIALISVIVILLIFSSSAKKDEIVGKKGRVVKINKETWVEIEGELWKARSEEKLSEGDEIEVLRRVGLTLEVKKVEKKDDNI
ncbi:hypothetical protein EYM_02140 [Ignicoccus islandicus DSM 13165]|uniref:NfeD-like C-terminal domain-containing protein n=1 Tax=Ignicoccus islandicus DSM 13165 TaxID=940295 RepID=A0A0U2VE24_9CREN|nr:NfeD family protein [Ignicoccus islandicus]ALU12290.1 hypothetical protein EYM_02140 [Ignicoccus islandicus DSM 13165]